MAKTLKPFKAGATYQRACQYLDKNSQPIDLTGYTIACELRTPRGVLVARLAGTLADQITDTGWFYLDPIEPDTSAWPTGSAKGDIRYSAGGIVVYTETFIQPIESPITAPEA
jgi:hypothetical protein